MFGILCGNKIIKYILHPDEFFDCVQTINRNAEYLKISVDEIDELRENEEYPDGEYLLDSIEIENIELYHVRKTTRISYGIFSNTLHVKINDIDKYTLITLTEDGDSDSQYSETLDNSSDNSSVNSENNSSDNSLDNSSYSDQISVSSDLIIAIPSVNKLSEKILESSSELTFDNSTDLFDSSIDSIDDKFDENEYIMTINPMFIIQKPFDNEEEKVEYDSDCTQDCGDVCNFSEIITNENKTDEKNNILPIINFVNTSEILESRRIRIMGGYGTERVNVIKTILNDKLNYSKCNYNQVVILTHSSNEETYNEQFDGLTYIFYDKIGTNKIYDKIETILNSHICFQKYFNDMKKIIVFDIDYDLTKEMFEFYSNNVIVNFIKSCKIINCDMIISNQINYLDDMENLIDMEFIVPSKNYLIKNFLYRRYFDMIFNEFTNKTLYNDLMEMCEELKRTIVIKKRKDTFENCVRLFQFNKKSTILNEIDLEKTIYTPQYYLFGNDKTRYQLTKDIIEKYKNDEYINLKNYNIYYASKEGNYKYEEFNNIKFTHNTRDKFIQDFLAYDNEFRFIIFDNCLISYLFKKKYKDIFMNPAKYNFGYIILNDKPYSCTNYLLKNNYIKHLFIFDDSYSGNYNIRNKYDDIIYFINNDNDHIIKKQLFDDAMTRYAKNEESCLVFSNHSFYTYFL
jgi:hypothetical protein